MPESPAAATAPWTPAVPDLRLADGVVIRELPPNEWHRLAETEGPFAGKPFPASDGCRVLVMEAPTGEIVGHWPVFDAVHLDGLWKRPDYRNRAILDRLFLGALVTMLQTLGVQYAFAVIREEDRETSGQLAETCGFEAKGRLYGGPIPDLVLPPRED